MCERPPEAPTELLASADVIFEGTAGASVEKAAPRNPRAFTMPSFTETQFTVTRMWKGAPVKSIAVGSSQPCGLSFQKGEQWLVFASKNEDGSLSTGRCTSSGKLDVAQRELALLAKGAPVKAPEATLSAWRAEKPGATRELRFSDKAGEHLVKFSLSDLKRRKSSEGYSRSRELLVTHSIGKKQVWQARDFVQQCEFDLSLEFLDGAIEVTDVDENGLGEISFLYVLGCRSDVSPDTMKLLMYEDATKYALRGESMVQVNATDFIGGEFQVDPSFDKAPAAFLDFARAKWKRFVTDVK